MSAAFRTRWCTAAALVLALAITGLAGLASEDRGASAHTVTASAAGPGDDNGWW
ncbi:hypothetical protein [Streptomyces sp. CB00455]|uniref:hypothetical protein n=1 Tax=Streptomyces sp. CB00455 TaxID=1703927 RepID=UPI000B24BAE1|nr:hypothetical protein [Streptomyces sp. CB00455]